MTSEELCKPVRIPEKIGNWQTQWQGTAFGSHSECGMIAKLADDAKKVLRITQFLLLQRYGRVGSYDLPPIYVNGQPIEFEPKRITLPEAMLR
jgi:hypothetical protein